ncbi:uncharacterized protein [Asterias amurensis]|uniref:uncharacterized protein n=1 Tax=Asterias amurensis TaxID=7602 RepID=UPI003AB2835B
MSGLKLPRRKRRVYQKVDSPFPIPIESITNKPASNQRWFYYTGVLKENCVLVQQQGDAIFLYKMGFFGKGILSKSKPEHEIFLNSYQGLRKKNLPPKERRFQQQRFQQVRKQRYERHLSWQKQLILQAQERAQINRTDPFTSDKEDLTQRQETHQGMECTDRVGTVHSDEEVCKVDDTEGQTMAANDVEIDFNQQNDGRTTDVDDAVTIATDANQVVGVDRVPIMTELLPMNLVACNDQVEASVTPQTERTDDVRGTSDDVIGIADDVIGTSDDVIGIADDVIGIADDFIGIADDVIGTGDVIGTADDVIGTGDDVIGTADDAIDQQTADTVTPQNANARTDVIGKSDDVMDKMDSERKDCALVTMKTVESGWEEGLPCTSADNNETGSTMDAEDQGFIRKDDPYKIHEHLQLKLEEAFFLSYGLGCLSVLDDNKKALDLTEMWQAFCSRQENFVANYIAYHYYRSKGWVPRDGVKYGAHFVLYKHGPPFYHGSYSIIVKMVTEGSWDTSDPLTWPALSGMDRITETVAKEVMFCYVLRPANLSDDEMTSPRCIPRFRVQEILMRRWVSSRERDLKDQLPPLIS